MTIGLVSRLLQIEQNDPTWGAAWGEPYARHMALNPFVEACFAVLAGRHTTLQIQTFYTMTGNDVVEFDTMIAQVQAKTTLEERMLSIHQIRSILTFWETGDITGYADPQDIANKLLNDL